MFKIFLNIIFLLTAGISFFVWISPEWNDISVLRENIKSYGDTLKKIESIQELRDKILKDYNSVEEGDRERLMKTLPKFLDEGAIMLIVDDLIKKNNLSLKSISFVEKRTSNSSFLIGTKNETYETENFTVEFGGSYEDFKKFLVNLEENLLPFDIKEISFSSDLGNKAKENRYFFKVVVETYWQN